MTTGPKQTEDPNRPTCQDCDIPMRKARGTTKGGRQRYMCRGCSASSTGSPEAKQHNHGYDRAAAKQRADVLRAKIRGGKKGFVITGAQNNTKPNSMFDSLKTYCEHNNYELIVVPMHYKNVSAYTGGQEYEKYWDASLEKHLIDQRVSLGGGVTLMGNIKITTTAVNPLSGMDSIGGNSWTIFVNPQAMMETVATPGDSRPKRMYTTGACTRANYSETKLGAKASFHHVNGALVVEIAKGKPFIRYLNGGQSGEFFDIAGGEVNLYSPDEVTRGYNILALAPGDGHLRFMNPKVMQATFVDMVEALKPEHLFHNDLMDSYFCSHHHEKDPIIQFKKHHTKLGDGTSELEEVMALVDSLPEDVQQHFVYSNHHDHLDQWVKRADVNKDPRNALLLLELQAALREDILKKRPAEGGALQLWMDARSPANYDFLSPNKPFIVSGVDYSQHGHIGTNGSRGTATGLAKAANKMVIGHSHGAKIFKGVYQTGVSTDRLEYEKGMSNHTHTHCIQYPNGKRALIDIFNGKWYGEHQ